MARLIGTYGIFSIGIGLVDIYNLFCALFDELSCAWRLEACLTSFIFRVLTTFFVTAHGLDNAKYCSKNHAK
jgi:hypothetical protein